MSILNQLADKALPARVGASLSAAYGGFHPSPEAIVGYGAVLVLAMIVLRDYRFGLFGRAIRSAR